MRKDSRTDMLWYVRAIIFYWYITIPTLILYLLSLPCINEAITSGLLVFYVTFNNISVIFWPSVLL
jgi:hypothetical protein